jgi:hypothetical protein
MSLGFSLVDFARVQLVMRGTPGYKAGDWADTWGLKALSYLVLTSAVCAAFGRGAARVLTIVGGILLTVVCFFLALSTIP